MYKKIKNNKAFTIIELITVVSIIGILVLIASFRFSGFTNKANIAVMESDILALSKASDILQVEDEIPFVENSLASGNILKHIEDKNIMRNVDRDKVKKYIKSLGNDYNDYGIIGEGKCAGKVFHLDGVENEHGVKEFSIGNDFRSVLTGCGIKVIREHYPDEKIDSLVKSGYIVVANMEDLAAVGKNTARTWGKGTRWEANVDKNGNPLIGAQNEKYIQVADIDLSSYKGSDNKGWEPIYNIRNGHYDGGGFEITNLNIDRDSKMQGLFRSISSASVKNISIIGGNITGGQNVGAIASYVSNSTVDNSYSNISVNGVSAIGGLVGELSNSTLINSYSRSNSKGHEDVGGLVGYAHKEAVIENSYSIGDIQAEYSAGGLAGGSKGLIIKNSYAIGLIDAKQTRNSGGLIGYDKAKDLSRVESSYWDIEKTGLLTSVGGTGLSTSEMKSEKSFEGWDFNKVWKLHSGQYPELRINDTTN